jgi:predicted  nucleic acid-binding Zn-ribbon protein
MMENYDKLKSSEFAMASENSSLKLAKESLEKQNAMLKDQKKLCLEEKTAEKVEMQNELEDFKQNHLQLYSENQNLLAAKNSADKLLRTIKFEKEDLAAQKLDLMRNNNEASENNTAMTNELEKYRKRANFAETTAEKLKLDHSMDHEKIRELETKLDSNIKQNLLFVGEAETLKGQIFNLEKSLRTLKADKHELTDGANNLHFEKTALADELSTKSESLVKAERKFIELEGKFFKARTEQEFWGEKCKSLENELENSKTQNLNHDYDYKRVAKERDDLLVKLRKLGDELREKTKEIERFMVDGSNQREKFGQLEGNNQNYKKEIDKIKGKMEKDFQENYDKNLDMAYRMSVAEEELEKNVNLYLGEKEKNGKLTIQLQKIKKDFEITKANGRVEKQGDAASVLDLTGQLEAKNYEIKEIQKTLKTEQGRFEYKVRECKELQATIDQGNERLLKFEKDNVKSETLKGTLGTELDAQKTNFKN